MKSFFCDTSALAKFYIHEKESERVKEALDASDRVFASEFAKAELVAVFHRKFREGLWDKKRFQASFRQFQADNLSQYWTWIPMTVAITDQVIQTYSELPASIFLRAADCFHLVSAMVSGFDQIVTYDQHQIKASGGMNLETIQF